MDTVKNVQWDGTLATVPEFELQPGAKLSTTIESLLIVLNKATVAAERELSDHYHDRAVDDGQRGFVDRLNAAIQTVRNSYYARPDLIANGYRCLGEWCDQIRRSRDSLLEIANMVLFNSSTSRWVTPRSHEPRNEDVLAAMQDIPRVLCDEHYIADKLILIAASALAEKVRNRDEKHSRAAAEWGVFRAIEFEYLHPRCGKDGVIATDGDGHVLHATKGSIGDDDWKILHDAVALREPSFELFDVFPDDSLFEWYRSDDFHKSEYITRELPYAAQYAAEPTGEGASHSEELPPIGLDEPRRQFIWHHGGKALKAEFTKIEFAILKRLIEAPGNYLNRDSLARGVLREGTDPANIRRHKDKINEKLADAHCPKSIYPKGEFLHFGIEGEGAHE